MDNKLKTTVTKGENSKQHSKGKKRGDHFSIALEMNRNKLKVIIYSNFS